MTGAVVKVEPTIGDRCRLREHPRAPLLTVVSLYLQGAGEVLYASLRWHKTAQLVYFPVSELVGESGA